ncbi:MAG: ankyrin repeat domain-containing protein [Alphaproteobacteria bacterium]
MKIFNKLSPERREEYVRRMNKVKKEHPDTYFPSDYHRTMLTIGMGGIDLMLTAEEMAPWFFRSGGIPSSVQKLAGDTMIHAAALGDTEECDFLQKKLWGNINKKNSKGDTPLSCAIERKRLGTAEWLLQRGAKIIPNKKGWNPVLLACADGCIPALNMFKHHGIDFNQPYPRWEWEKGLPKKHFTYPIEVAVLSNHPNAPKVVQWLLDNGVSIDNKKEKGLLSIREVLLKKPEVLDPEVRQILRIKVAQTPLPQPVKQQKISLGRLSFWRTKERN